MVIKLWPRNDALMQLTHKKMLGLTVGKNKRTILRDIIHTIDCFNMECMVFQKIDSISFKQNT